jgi:8-oxo-dGTP diphosphatase
MNVTLVKDWSVWQPTERATLCFVVRDGWILLIRKKRGLGAGKVNGPGGRLEAGESLLQCAVRETQEELGVTPIDPEWRGELFFQFVDGYGLHCAVFTAADCEGEAIETDEAAPLWTPVDAIPFQEMWADDEHWLPGVLAGRNFRAFFDFDGDAMLSRRVEWLERESRPNTALFK